MKRCIKVMGFICICIIISLLCRFVLTPSSYLRVVLHEVKNAEKPYDLVFIGQSRGESNINPYVLDDVMEYNSYNLCRRIVKMPDLPYLLKEADSKKQIGVCVLHVDQAYFYDITPNYFSDAFIFPHISDLVNQIEYYYRYMLNTDFRVSLMRYTLEGMGDLRLSAVRVSDKLSDGYREYSMDAVTDTDVDHVYVGRGYRKGIAYSNNPTSGSKWDRRRIQDKAIESVREIKEYCDQRGIKLIAIHDPVPHERFTVDEHMDQKDYFEDLFGEMGIDYIDFNYIDEKYLVWDETGYSDGEGHMMSDMADDYSRILGEVLQKKLDGESIEEFFSDSPNMGAL